MDVGLSGLPVVSQGRSETLRGRGPVVRRQREFTPAEKKDTVYWEKRRKNNEAAKRSREKRRLNDAALESRLAALLEENALLRAELWALRHRCGLLPSIAGSRTLPLQALLWEPPWTGELGSRAEPLPFLPGSHGCLLRPCALDTGVPGCRGCLVAHKWTGLASSPRCPQDPAPHPPKRMDMALQAALPATLFSCHLLDEHGGTRPELRPFWGLWSPMASGYQAPGPSDVLLPPTADPTQLPPGMAYPVPGSDPEGLPQPSLPHKLRIKSQALGRGPPGWGSGRAPL
ncbi:nuclear factor interleukin-3-regulated protein [Mustela erminea]|uniref:nuclear factor interleukin-3-regulated protein n=1 Tax=Mustela erminea TaxID=36723 RepID=UPI001386A590|nr:nuclear factor interleukin-3-regulated protein [Mustela erminea]XP_032164431.1 nuclear factor interleukin-3-regulated protein [Mustela erminea]XP_032164438.1 nuclear factor interleukin-3-regulated protein [Mustela erminea]XP_032164448.1 nuclear factor interleukin-3-regulated protein [Mustela erminea]XP_032164456.1 nuclear factor interleukin-3-regulated protein [Mustela erminea]XP_032164462.1 nuclear factor interleukin-3-regulated protein [Mustela erminea]